MSKKEYERLKREIAERKAKARSQSEERQEEIKVLWDLDERQLKAAKNPKERKGIEQKLKKQKLKKLLNSVGKLANDEKIIDRIRELIESEELAEDENIFDRIRELVDLAILQDGEIEYLTQFRRDWESIQVHYPQQLENLHRASIMALLQPFLLNLPKRKGKAEWEYKRRRYNLFGDVGLIEYQFGGAGEAEWRKRLLSLPGLPYEPTCLDDVFAGGAVKMHDSEGEMIFMGQSHRVSKPGLQRLFGMNRNRFPKNLPGKKDGRETWYRFRAVEKIMRALLSEPKERKTSARGAPRQLWLSDLSDPDLRMRVLSGIAARINNLANLMSIQLEETDVSKLSDKELQFVRMVFEHFQGYPEWQRGVAEAFLDVVRCHLPDSAKK